MADVGVWQPASTLLAYQERTTDDIARGAAFDDIAGLTITFTPTIPNPYIHLCLPSVFKDATPGYVWSAITDSANGGLAQAIDNAVANGFVSQDIWARRPNLTPGVPITIKARISCQAGQATVKGADAGKPFIEALVRP